jgi:hypothetical protein
MARGIKLSLGAHSSYDQGFSKVTTITTCTIMNYVHYTIFRKVTLAMTMLVKVQKLSLLIRKLIHCRVWWRKGGKPLSIHVFHFSK